MGIHFTRKPKTKGALTKNSGVRFDATNDDGTKDTYYGCIQQIWEIDYGPAFKIPLFQCKWVNLAGGVETDRRYGMTTVDLNNLGYHTVTAPD